MKTLRGLIGVIHLPPLPGDPRAAQNPSFGSALDHARRDFDALVAGGAGAVVVENYGSAPFAKGTPDDPIPPHQAAAITLAVRHCVQGSALPVGVNCLRNDARTALAIAAAAGASFVRINIHTGAYVTDQGVIEGTAADTLRYRKALGAEEVAILADVLVKHAQPLVPISEARATADTVQRGLADGVIVTGPSTGAPASADRVRAVRGAAGDAPVFIGSGLNPDNVGGISGLIDGAIVGTWLKRDGAIENPVDAERVRKMADALGQHLR